MVVLGGIFEEELDFDLGVEGVDVLGGEIGGGVEGEAVGACGEWRGIC